MCGEAFPSESAKLPCARSFEGGRILANLGETYHFGESSSVWDDA